MTHTNIEIKARCSEQNKIRTFLKENNADYKGLDHQIDTYFNVNSGRLKLREGNIENALIYYNREDIEGPKEADIILFKVEPGTSIKEILTNSLGIKVIIDKKREIYFIDNVKFHIDDVKDLGTFVEIEAIDETGEIGKEKLLEQCNHFLQKFNIPESDLISVSYSDLLLEK